MFGACEKVAEFIDSKFTERAIRLIRAAYKDDLTFACNLDARAGVTGT
jgi:hypothetical protein